MEPLCQSRPLPGEIYLSGAVVPAGTYHLVGTDIKIRLEKTGSLPACSDGRMACYETVAAAEMRLSRRTRE